MWLREKNRGVQEKFFGREGVFTKFLKVGGVQNLIFPSDDLFLNKNTDFCWEIAKIFKSWGCTPCGRHIPACTCIHGTSYLFSSVVNT